MAVTVAVVPLILETLALHHFHLAALKNPSQERVVAKVREIEARSSHSVDAGDSRSLTWILMTAAPAPADVVPHASNVLSSGKG